MSSLATFVWGHVSRLPDDVVITIRSPSHNNVQSRISSSVIPDGVFVTHMPLEQFETALARQIIQFRYEHDRLKDLGITWGDEQDGRRSLVGVVSEETLKEKYVPLGESRT